MFQYFMEDIGFLVDKGGNQFFCSDGMANEGGWRMRISIYFKDYSQSGRQAFTLLRSV